MAEATFDGRLRGQGGGSSSKAKQVVVVNMVVFDSTLVSTIHRPHAARTLLTSSGKRSDISASKVNPLLASPSFPKKKL